MANSGYSRSPSVQKGALVQITRTLDIPTPYIVPFQYNPETVKRTLSPWNPLDNNEAYVAQLPSLAQPYDPQETISLSIELDASDELADANFVTQEFGVAPRIAAIEQMLLPEASPIDQVLELFHEGLTSSIEKLSGVTGRSMPPISQRKVPVVFFVWGVGRIVPVRITDYSIEEQLFMPSLRPLQAKVDLTLDVLTSHAFREVDGSQKNNSTKNNSKDPVYSLAKGAYELYRAQRVTLAASNLVNAAGELRALLPF